MHWLANKNRFTDIIFKGNFPYKPYLVMITKISILSLTDMENINFLCKIANSQQIK